MFDPRVTEERAAARVGGRLSRWTLERCVDVDVLGDSYLASSTNGDACEVFVLNEDLASDAEIREELSTAPGLLRKLAHTALIGFSDTATTPEGVPYYAAKLAPGETWKEILMRRPHGMAPAEALRISAEVFEILAVLHDRGLVHGSIEPRFVFLTESGEVRLRGFPLAKARARAANLLELKHPPGSLGFTAPNQIVGEPPNPSSDLWSAVAVALYALSGHYPYAGETESERERSATLGRTQTLARIEPETSRPLLDLFEYALDGSATDARKLAARFRDVSDAREVRMLRHLRDEVPPRRSASSRPPPPELREIEASSPPVGPRPGHRPRGSYSQMSPAVTARTVPQFDPIESARVPVIEDPENPPRGNPRSRSRPPRR